jgi:transcriptional regulator with XRE-family HTH domain
MEYSLEALGQVIREQRVAVPLTQEELGTKAQYRSGAGVSISRIENGLTRPGTERLDRIALALGVTVGQLESAAAVRTTDLAVEQGEANDQPASRKRSQDRYKRLCEELERRKKVGGELCAAYNKAEDRSRDAFLTKFIEIAYGIDGALPTEAGSVKNDGLTDPKAEAVLRLTPSGVAQAPAVDPPSPATIAAARAVGPAVGSAAAYATFRTVVARGAASTGASTSDLFGIAQLNAAFAIIGGGTLANGGAGVAGGKRRLKDIEVGTGLIAELSLVLLKATYDLRKQRRELAEKLDAEIGATRRGFAALEDLIPRATGVLDDIAVHAGRALGKWEAKLGPRPLKWNALELSQRERYEDFVKIAFCHLSVAAINFPELMESRGEEREHLILSADMVLNEAQEVVGSLV